MQLLTTLEIENLHFGDVQKSEVKPKHSIPVIPTLMLKTEVNKLASGLDAADFQMFVSKKEAATIVKLEERALQAALHRRGQVPWFEEESMRDAFESRLSFPTDASATLTVRKAADFKVFDLEDHQISDVDLPDDAYVFALLEVPHLSFAKQKFGCIAYVKQLVQVAPPEPVSETDAGSDHSEHPAPDDVDTEI